jgi:hypothetical protein
MHDDCTATFGNGQAVVDKVRRMGFSQGELTAPLELSCLHCGAPLRMTTFEFACPTCRAVHAVTPCHSHSAGHVQCAGPDY